MKRLSMALALMLVLGVGSVWAQDVPKVEGFVGGSIANIEDGAFKLSPFGWTASVTGNTSSAFGIVGEVAGSYRRGTKIHNFLGGAQFSGRGDKLSGFFQAKAGIVHFSGGGSSDNNFQLGFGGGVDYKMSDNMAFRIFQIDWLPTRVQSGTGHDWVTNYTRASIGIVFKGAPR